MVENRLPLLGGEARSEAGCLFLLNVSGLSPIQVESFLSIFILNFGFLESAGFELPISNPP